MEIKKFLEKSDLDTYTKCIKDRKPKCYTDEETCSIGKYPLKGGGTQQHTVMVYKNALKHFLASVVCT